MDFQGYYGFKSILFYFLKKSFPKPRCSAFVGKNLLGHGPKCPLKSISTVLNALKFHFFLSPIIFNCFIIQKIFLQNFEEYVVNYTSHEALVKYFTRTMRFLIIKSCVIFKICVSPPVGIRNFT